MPTSLKSSDVWASALGALCQIQNEAPRGGCRALAAQRPGCLMAWGLRNAEWRSLAQDRTGWCEISALFSARQMSRHEAKPSRRSAWRLASSSGYGWIWVV